MSFTVFICITTGTVGYIVSEVSWKCKRWGLTAGAAVIGFYGHCMALGQFGFGKLYLIYLGLGMLLVLLSISDWLTLALPLPLLLVGYLMGAVVLIAEWKAEWWIEVAIAVLVLGAMLVLSRVLRGGIGEGDAHVLAFLILGLGWRHGLVVFLVALLLSAVLGIGLMVIGGKSKKTELPFLPFVMTAHFLLLLA